MDTVDEKIKGKNIVFFDGYCNLCNKAVNFLMNRDKKKRFYYASLQSDLFQKISIKHNLKPVDSVVLLKGKQIFIKSGAVLEIAKTMGGVYSLITIFKIIPSAFRNKLYDWIAKKRYSWFGKKNTCRIPTDEEKAFFLE